MCRRVSVWGVDREVFLVAVRGSVDVTRYTAR